MSLDGKVAVVTGGGSGMGHETCAQLARDGAAVAVQDIAAAISYLCPVAAKHINGHTLSVNGGNYMN